MKVGLPGVGIGGVFYVLLVAWMPARELWLTLHGRSSRHRWRRIGVQAGLAAAIVGALWAEWWVLVRLPEAASAAWGLLAAEAAGPAALIAEDMAAGDGSALDFLAPTLAATPFVIVALILVALRVARMVALRAPAPVAAGVLRDGRRAVPT